jgi:hypothetical protein
MLRGAYFRFAQTTSPTQRRSYRQTAEAVRGAGDVARTPNLKYAQLRGAQTPQERALRLCDFAGPQAILHTIDSLRPLHLSVLALRQTCEGIMLAGDAQQPQRAASAVTNGGNPFIGARPFLAPPLAAQFFCSRRSDVQELCALIHSSRLVILHGGAGVGKSSLLHAALLPALATTGCQVLELPVTWPDEQRLAWLAQTRQQFAPQDAVLVVDPADALAADTDCLTHCLALLTDAPRLRILFSLRSTPATHLASVLQGAGWNVAVYGLTPPPVAALAPALAASLGHAPGADAVAARFLAALGGAAGDDTVEPALLQLAGRALWPNRRSAHRLRWRRAWTPHWLSTASTPSTPH